MRKLRTTTRESPCTATKTQHSQNLKKRKQTLTSFNDFPLGWVSWWLNWFKNHSIWHSSLCFSTSFHISQPWLFSVQAPLHVLPRSYFTDPGPQGGGGLTGPWSFASSDLTELAPNCSSRKTDRPGTGSPRRSASRSGRCGAWHTGSPCCLRGLHGRHLWLQKRSLPKTQA